MRLCRIHIIISVGGMGEEERYKKEDGGEREREDGGIGSRREGMRRE